MTANAVAAARRTLAAGYWTLQVLLLFIAAAWLAWHCLAAVNFGYPVWHDALGIDTTIERYAPRNRYRDDFEQTTPAERARLFAAIVDAIHAEGRGLADLRYYDPEGRELGRLLRPPEIVHLRDVARLVRWFETAGIAALALVMGLAAEARWRRRSPPPARRFLAGAAALLVVAGLGLLAIGPVELFYALHEVVFPDDHQWFFWYEDSLMSTMMQAPKLFGAIAAVWIPFAFALAGAGLWAIGRFLQWGRPASAA